MEDSHTRAKLLLSNVYAIFKKIVKSYLFFAEIIIILQVGMAYYCLKKITFLHL